MNQNICNEAEYRYSPKNSNTFLLHNSLKYDSDNQSVLNNDNFWTVDPFQIGDQQQLTTGPILRSNSDSYLSHNFPNCSSPVDNPNDSVITSDVCCTQEKQSVEPSGLLTKEQVISKPISQKQKKKFYRKLPIHYIDTKDWQSYMEVATIRNASVSNNLTLGLITNGMSKPGKFKNNKIHRLLNSIYNLYQDYTELSDEYERLNNQISSKSMSTDSLSSDDFGEILKDPLRFSIKKKRIKHKPFPINIPETNSLLFKNSDGSSTKNTGHELINSSSQTYPILEWSELSDSQLADVAFNLNILNDSSKKWSSPTNSSAKRSHMSSLSESMVTPSKMKRLKIFDHLTRQNFLGEQAIDILEELLCNRIVLCHKVNLIDSYNNTQGPNISPDESSVNDNVNPPNFIFSSIATALRCATSKSGNNSNHNSSTLINLPIIMDLMLPKMQTKIRQIFEECSFLNNPLEIMAELRHFNYNKTATIEHFRNTRQLRGIIKEFINNSIDSRCRLVILRCLYRNYNSFRDKTQSKPFLSCSNCGKEFIADDEFFNGNISTNRGLSSDDEMGDFKLPDENIDDFNPIQLAAYEAEKATVDMYSKSTLIERGSLDHGYQDSCSQTQQSTFLVDLKVLKGFAEIVFKTLSSLRLSVTESKTQICNLRRQVSGLIRTLKNNIDLIISLSNKHFMSDQHRNRVMLLARQIEELKLKLKDEETKRRSVYNLMQEQMGNVRVYCRCRDVPFNENVLEIQGNESIVLPILPQERFDFDKVFPSSMSQNEIYEEFQSLVMSFIDGFNVCFITYGSEASGKTYTLIGGNLEVIEEHGIMQRALNTLLSEQKARNRDWEYQITACLVEIYNDNCIDLLSGESGIQLYVDCGMESVYQKLKSVPITNESDTEILLQLCRAKRKVAKTALNPSSSRSHLVTLIRLQGKSKIHGENIRSFMCLCDLAGFEDIIKAETQSNKTLSKEAGYINKSLTAFNRVFVSLRRQDPNTVCYRDTKLTHLLKPFLTNSGKCALVITIRTDRRSLSSTQNTLRFGRETRGVSLGKARRQVNSNQPV